MKEIRRAVLIGDGMRSTERLAVRFSHDSPSLGFIAP
jgi:hypothetical protein